MVDSRFVQVQALYLLLCIIPDQHQIVYIPNVNLQLHEEIIFSFQAIQHRRNITKCVIVELQGYLRLEKTFSIQGQVNHHQSTDFIRHPWGILRAVASRWACGGGGGIPSPQNLQKQKSQQKHKYTIYYQLLLYAHMMEVMKF